MTVGGFWFFFYTDGNLEWLLVGSLEAGVMVKGLAGATQGHSCEAASIHRGTQVRMYRMVASALLADGQQCVLLLIARSA